MTMKTQLKSLMYTFIVIGGGEVVVMDIILGLCLRLRDMISNLSAILQ